MRYFEDLEVGEQFRTPARTVTEADVLAPAAISGDHEVLDRAAGGDPDGVPAPEFLAFAVSSGLGFRVPVDQPPILAFMTFDWRAVAPVRIGDTIHCRIRIAQKRPMKDAGVLVEKREVVNQRGEVVQEAEYKLLVARRPAS